MKSTKDLSLRQELRSTFIMVQQETDKYDSHSPDADSAYLTKLSHRLYDLRCRAYQKGYSDEEIADITQGR